MIKKFYTPFHAKVESTLETAERAKGERILGEDPESGKPISVRIGRFGPMAQIGTVEDEDKPRFASLLSNQSIDTINLEEALELFKLPRVLGNHEGQEVVAAIGRYGPYVRFEKTFASIPKDSEDTVFSISLETAIGLINDRQQSEKLKFIKTFPENDSIQVLNGRYGPYIKEGKKNYKIPKDQEPKDLTLDDCKAIIEKKKKS
jgi:DNA topoisomerase-1